MTNALIALLPLVAAATALPPDRTRDECAVWNREMSFARSVSEHDARAFADHVEADAVFAAGSAQPQRGRDTVLRAWAPIVRGQGLRLEWYPQRTTVAGELAWSTGPALFERLDGGSPRLAIGAFQSVWRRGADGEWRVLFDAGTPPQAVDEAAAAAFRAARPAACPAG